MARIQRAPQLIAKLKRLREVTADKVKPAMIQAGDVIVAEQKRLLASHTDTGDLRNSIMHSFTSPGGKTGSEATKNPNPTRLYITAGNEKTVVSGEQYARIIEFGRKNAPAFPFFFPGYRAVKRKAKSIINRAVSKAVREAVK